MTYTQEVLNRIESLVKSSEERIKFAEEITADIDTMKAAIEQRQGKLNGAAYIAINDTKYCMKLVVEGLRDDT